MDDGREDHFVGLDEEPRGLQADDQVLAGDDVGLALAHLGAMAHAPDLDPPGGEVLGHVEGHFGGAVALGGEVADPEGGVGELGPQRRLDQRAASTVAGLAASRGAIHHAAHHLRRRRHGGRHGRRGLRLRLQRPRRPWRTPSSRRGGAVPYAAGTVEVQDALSVLLLACFILRILLRHAAAEDAQVAHADRVRRNEVTERPAEVGLRLRRVVPLPLPEEFLDLRDVRAAGDVLDRLVVDRHHGRAHEGLALGVGQLDLHLGLLARPVGRRRGDDRDVQHPFLGRDGDLPDFGVDAAVGHGHRLDEEVGHVLLRHLDLRHRALAVHADDPRRQIDAVGRPGEQQHRAAGPIGVDLQLHLLARGIVGLLRNQFQVVETELRAIKALADDGEEVAALDGVVLAVGQLVGEAILPRLEAVSCCWACPSASVGSTQVWHRASPPARGCRSCPSDR